MLAHGGTPDEQVSLVIVIGALWIGWTGWSRIRGNGFPRIPLAAAYALIGLAVVVMFAGLTLPRQFMRPASSALASAGPTGARPASTAALAITRPTAGQTVTGNSLIVVMTLTGGRIIDASTTTLTPDTGHIHISIDGALQSMTFGLVQELDVRSLAPGPHTLTAEFVAADHGPFDPRGITSVTFTKGSG
jgi:hypothetical protein